MQLNDWGVFATHYVDSMFAPEMLPRLSLMAPMRFETLRGFPPRPAVADIITIEVEGNIGAEKYFAVNENAKRLLREQGYREEEIVHELGNLAPLRHLDALLEKVADQDPKFFAAAQAVVKLTKRKERSIFLGKPTAERKRNAELHDFSSLAIDMFIAVYAPRSADSRKKLGKMFGEKFWVGKVTSLYNAREKEAKASPGYAPAGKVGIFFAH